MKNVVLSVRLIIKKGVNQEGRGGHKNRADTCNIDRQKIKAYCLDRDGCATALCTACPCAIRSWMQ